MLRKLLIGKLYDSRMLLRLRLLSYVVIYNPSNNVLNLSENIIHCVDQEGGINTSPALIKQAYHVKCNQTLHSMPIK